jgi:hypothetical protein
MAAPYGTAAGAGASPLLNSLSHLLAAQTPQLQTLHRLLDLPREQTSVDLDRLEEVLKAELERIVRERTEEVAGWRARIETVRHGQSSPRLPSRLQELGLTGEACLRPGS